MACGSCRFPQAGSSTQHLPRFNGRSMEGTTQDTMCCAALFITFFVFTVCLLRRYDSVTSCNPPPRTTPPKSVDKEVLRRRLRGVLISQVRAFAHVFTCPMRVVTEWPLLSSFLRTEWPLYFPSSARYLLPSTCSTPSPSAACPADVSLSPAWQLQLVRVHMNKHRLHP